MLHTSFVVTPIPEYAFFEKTQFECLLRNHFLEILCLAAQFLHLISVCSARCISGQPLLPGLHEVLGPLVIDTLRYALTATQFGNAVLPRKPSSTILIFSSDE